MSTVVLMAGGTGGHLFPAMALAQELNRRGHEVHLATDERVESYGQDFPAKQVHIIPAATPSLSNPIKFIGAGFKILGGIAVAWRKLGAIKPDVAVAFGGYPCFPPFLATSLMGVPGILHEQNAVLGRANRALARFADVLALHFAETRYAEKFSLEKAVTGNPVRDRVQRAAAMPYPEISEASPLQLLVFGGSQGARAFSELVPPAITALPEAIRSRLHVTQQCRPEDLQAVTAIYAEAKVSVELASFFSDLPERMAKSHLVIGRSGASTIAELSAIGRPAILVPLPGSLDQDQRANATVFESAGGGWLVDQATLSPQTLCTTLADLLASGETLTEAARAAKSVGHPDAVLRLANIVEDLAPGPGRGE